MKLPRDAWTCLDEDVGVWARTYAFNSSGGYSNTFVVRTGARELMIISPPNGMRPDDFESLEAHGRITAIVAPNGFHHLGLPEWIRRYPGAGVFANAKAAKRIAKKHPTLPPLRPIEELAAQLPEHVAVFDGPDMKVPDVFARVEVDGGYIWYSNDVLVNMPKLPSNPIVKAMFKWTRSGPGFVVNRLVMKFLRGGPAFGPWLKREIAEHPPKVVVPGHGFAVVEGDVAAQTRAVLEAGL